MGSGKPQPHTQKVIVILAAERRLDGHLVSAGQHGNQRLCRSAAGGIVVQSEGDLADAGMLRQIPFQRQRHGAFLQFLFGLVDPGQRNQMLPVPISTVHFHEGGIGQ